MSRFLFLALLTGLLIWQSQPAQQPHHRHHTRSAQHATHAHKSDAYKP